MEEKLTHFDEQGDAQVVDTEGKQEADRATITHGFITTSPKVYQAAVNGTAKKDDVLDVAWVTGIMGAKEASGLVPLCHVLILTKYAVEFALHEERCAVEAICMVKTHGRTGVEMEALTGVQIASLMICDMCKTMGKGMMVSNVCLLKKYGGESGLYERKTSRLGAGEKER